MEREKEKELLKNIEIKNKEEKVQILYVIKSEKIQQRKEKDIKVNLLKIKKLI